MDNLGEAISAYETALANLPLAEAEDSRSRVIDVFIARDNVALALANKQTVTSAMLERIIELDQRLKKDAKRVNKIARRFALAEWRESIKPPGGAWWWRLDAHAAAEQRFISKGVLLTWLGWILIAISLSFILEVVRRFLSTGADVPSIVLQGVLALLVGSTIIQLVGQVAGGSPLQAGGRIHPNHKTQIVLVASFVVVAVGMELFRSRVVDHYSNQGVLSKQQGQLTTAIENYQRAISLKPDDSLAHYNLASAYEGTLDYDKAESEFQSAIRCDDQYSLAYNRLARLYMLRRGDYVTALMILKTGLDKLDLMQEHNLLSEADYRDIRFALLRNRGWAYFGLGFFRQAANDLRLALEIRPRGAVAHCLLAQVLEAEKNPQRDQERANEEYEKCVADSLAYSDIEENWLSLARERLLSQEPELQKKGKSK